MKNRTNRTGRIKNTKFKAKGTVYFDLAEAGRISQASLASVGAQLYSIGLNLGYRVRFNAQRAKRQGPVMAGVAEEVWRMVEVPAS